jgi:Protein of unknown function (DUF3616)
MQAGPTRHTLLDYTAIVDKMVTTPKRGAGTEKDTSRIANVSALAPVGAYLWTASDEEASIERLTRHGDGYAAARSWDLEELFPAFAAERKRAKKKGKDGHKSEADLEGLAFDPDKQRLWLVGSHSRGRGSMTGVAPEILRAPFDPKHREAPLRTLLGFVPVGEQGEPAIGAGLALPFGERRGGLRACVKSADGQLAKALNWPSKENGFDIEGIAAHDSQVLLGLRGPAAGGYAVVLRLSIAIGARALSLGGASYGLSLLKLNGLGVRDLCRQGDDVLVLAGPTMDLDAPFALYRWHDAFARRRKRDEILEVGSKQLEFLFDFATPKRDLEGGRPVPHPRPEGIAVIGGSALLVVHDRPGRRRLERRGTLQADLLELPGSKKPRRPRA